MLSILQFGAIADGAFDCSSAISKALAECEEILFPDGVYLISQPIRIPSNRKIKLSDNATIFAKSNCFNKAGIRAVITNSDYENGNCNIVFEGGRVDANCLENARESWCDGPSSGLTFCFQNVDNFTIKNVRIHNSEAYNVRLTRASNFVVEGVTFTATHYPPCQDGIHVSGFSHHGIIRNIRALGKCSNDDLIAFNADDVNYYCHNWGQENGPISDMLVENVYAENCWTAVRILSIDSLVSNITIRNLTAGIRCHAINLDAARYCADPIFTDQQKPNGVGKLDNILFENITLHKTKDANDAHFCVLETKGNVVFNNLKRDYSLDAHPEIPTLKIKNLPNHTVSVNGQSFVSDGTQRLIDGDEFNLIIKDNSTLC